VATGVVFFGVVLLEAGAARRVVPTGTVRSKNDIEWIVHRAAIRSNGPSKGVLKRSRTKLSVAPFVDCAAYNYATLLHPSAIHTCDLSRYET